MSNIFIADSVKVPKCGMCGERHFKFEECPETYKMTPAAHMREILAAGLSAKELGPILAAGLEGGFSWAHTEKGRFIGAMSPTSLGA